MVNSGEPGRLLGGRYRLHEPLGRGGMGTVWRGTDEVLGRDVAVKEVVYPPELAEGDRAMLRERTMREARAVARITHPSVVTVYDVVREDDRPWIVMELVAGRSLADMLDAEGGLPTHRVAQVGLDLLAAVERAHAAGVLHRDIKPANVLLADDGRVTLTDFGIASVEGDPSLTSTGLVLGSPAFMAPERARSEQPGPPTDLWGVGATLYAAVEGRAPFERSGPLATVTALVTEDPDPLTVTGPLRKTIEGLLVKDPRSRLDIQAARRLLRQAASEPAASERPTPTAVVPPAEAEAPTRTAAPSEQATPAPHPAPVQADEPRDRAARRGRWRAALSGLAAIAAVVAVLAYGFAEQQPAERTDRQPGRAAASPAGSPTTPEPTASSPPATLTSEPGGASTPPSLPDAFRMHRDPTGFSIAVPRGWDRVTYGSNIDFREPGSDGRRFLRIGHSGDPRPDPVEDWKQQEQSFRERYSGYERIRIEQVRYRHYEAADWEFEFDTDSGRRLHVLNRAAVTSRDHAYAIYWSTPAGQWEDSRDYFDVFARTFRPAG